MTNPIANYANTIAHDFEQPKSVQLEEWLKSPVSELLRATGQTLGLDVTCRPEVSTGELGRPDISVFMDSGIVGQIELKRPSIAPRPETFPVRSHNGQQWRNYQDFSNLIYTNGSEWSLYRAGKHIARVQISDDVSKHGASGLHSDKVLEFERLLSDFLYYEPESPDSADALAEFLARMARILRRDVNLALKRGSVPLRRLANEWGDLLFPQADDDQFADAYAQTLTYALLLARFEGAESLRPAFAADALQAEHGLLSEAVSLLEVPSVREELRMSIELLERSVEAVDAAAIWREDDPWIYFYEHFLGAYDPKLRKERGVYFTPVEIVRAQVRLVGELLRTRFRKRMAFADDDVVVLDPAVGTGTYPLAVLDHAQDAIRRRLGQGAVPGKLNDLAGRLNGFELLVGPYAVANLRISQRLRAAAADAPARVFLTDTLESPNSLPDFTASLLQEHLTRERQRAQQIKKDTRVFVCIGNPPYHRESDESAGDEGRRKGGWVRYGDEGQNQPPILEDFLAPVREAGDSGHLKNVYNDYVYFWRWALWKVLDSTDDAGIVSFITASSYLRGPGFAGMRRKMREVFDELWIIDLGGDSLGARKTENVFSIRIPVAIAIGVRNGAPNPTTPARVLKTTLVGPERAKLEALDDACSFADLDWKECSSDWNAPFHSAGVGAYFDFPKLTDVFPWQHSGVQLKRTWPIGVSRDMISDRWRSLLGRSTAGRRTAFRETRDRKIERSYHPLIGGGDKAVPIGSLDSSSPLPAIVRYAFRSFDRQFVIADSRVGDFMRPPLWQAHSPKQVYMTGLLTDIIGEGPVAVATGEIPDLHHFHGRGGKDVIPLWRDAKATQPNVTRGIIETLGERYGAPVSLERLFAYVYGILAQPGYVRRFWDELEIPPPRLPITKDATLFERVAQHGAQLLYLHTWGERFAGADDDGFVPQGAARCVMPVSGDGFSHDEDKQTLSVGDGQFAPVSPEVWNFSVSGFQIVRSWLDRRKLNKSGKRSSPLDDIRPERWDFTEELLELLWLLEATLDMRPEGAALLEQVCAGSLFSRDELPTPTDKERKPPSTRSATQRTLLESR